MWKNYDLKYQAVFPFKSFVGFFFFGHTVLYGILVPQPGIEPALPELETQS